ncbi:hypothetical protein CDAR_82681 [Caerostris darwini]|uniref:Uncharacterized protein n=1 Tax=Caerostris darwini TaxID=1538125 RepID=A0AAV4NAD4_9ARAC|nr:hypothetical protein CDAR_82681 [Caerostris darwini]
MSTNQTTIANATERHRATESRTQESSEHRDERLRLQRERLRAAREQDVARIEHMIKRDSKPVAHYHVSLFFVLRSSIPQTSIILRIQRSPSVQWIKYADTIRL